MIKRRETNRNGLIIRENLASKRGNYICASSQTFTEGLTHGLLLIE